MGTFVVYSDAADGYIYTQDVSLSVGRSSAAAGKTANTLSATFIVGEYVSGTYWTYQAFLDFDTSAVTGTPLDVVLSISLSLDNTTSPASFTTNARAYDWGATLEVADWLGADAAAAPLRASHTTVGALYNDFVSDASFKDNLANPVRLVLTNAYTEAGGTANPPIGSSYVQWSASEAAGTTADPKLTITTADGPMQTVLPDADLATTGWTTTPLFSKVNDTSDATVITGALV